MLAFLTLGSVMWRASGEIMALFFFGYIGISVGIGLGLYAGLAQEAETVGTQALPVPGRLIPGWVCRDL